MSAIPFIISCVCRSADVYEATRLQIVDALTGTKFDPELDGKGPTDMNVYVQE